MSVQGSLLHRWQDKRLAFDKTVRSDWRLLETDDQLLQELIYNGVTIKGNADQEAVLCTEQATYAIKHVETTNTLFMVSGSEESHGDMGGTVSVKATSAAHLELTQSAPQLRELDTVLEATQLRGEDESASTSGQESRPPMTFDELLSVTQASAAELQVALQQRGALELDGCWRVMSAAMLGDTLEVLLLTSAQHGWGACIPLPQACEAMSADGFDPRLTAHCLRLHSHKAGAPLYEAATLDTHKVCLHFARKLLRERSKWPVHAFMQAWQSSTPEGMTVDAAMLRGEALVEGRPGAEDCILALSVADLPTEPGARFAELFAARPQWELRDLEPYLADLQAEDRVKGLLQAQVPGRSAEALLLTYARASQSHSSAAVLYSAR